MSLIPSEKEFAIFVAQHPEKKLIGMKVRTSMQTCQEDAPRLWYDQIAPILAQLYPEGNCLTWGASRAYDAATGNFDYWAAFVLPEGQPMPEGFEKLTLPSGLYAQCQLNAIAEIHTAYHYLYSRWLPSHPDHLCQEDGICFEAYPADFLKTGQLSLHIPVRKC